MLTESQYESLLGNINEQKKTRGSFGKTLGTKTYKIPLLKKEDGYEFNLPDSDNISEIDGLISESEVEEYYNNKEIFDTLKKLNGSAKIYNLRKVNKKYYSLVAKTYSWLVEKNPDNKPKNITIDDKWVPDPVTPPKPVDPPKPEEPKLFRFPMNGEGKQYFLDNEWILTNTFKNEFKTEILDKIIQAKTINPKMVISLPELKIDTSCSRLTNGKPIKSPGADNYSKSGITFEQLSTERNNAARDYVINELRNVGVNVENTNIIPNVKGGNGDGTSGPKYAGVNRREFDKYKYLNMDFKFVGLFGDNPEPIPVTSKTIKTSHLVFQVGFNANDIPYTFRGPGLYAKWNPNVPVKKVCKRTKNGVSCEEIQNLNGPVNDPWTGLDAYFQPKDVNFNNK